MGCANNTHKILAYNFININSWNCPYCEIDRLTAQLEQASKDRNKMGRLWATAIKKCVELEDRLAEREKLIENQQAEIASYKTQNNNLFQQNKNLGSANDALRAEVERLKSVDCSTCAGREITEIITYTRKRTAQECYNLVNIDGHESGEDLLIDIAYSDYKHDLELLKKLMGS